MASAYTKKKVIVKKKKGNVETLGGTETMSLTQFKPVMWPTCMPVKLVYSDYRVLTCASSQAEYVYRLNGVFDPDQTGVGGQPDGFDELKLMYGRYRVVAAKVEVECVGQASNGLLAIAPTDTVGPFLSAEEIGGLRYAKAQAFSSTTPGRVKALYHIGKLLGYSDEMALSSSDLQSAISGNPNFQSYLVVAIEGGSSATQSQNIWVKITYYTRMEVPIAILDATPARYQRHRMMCETARQQIEPQVLVAPVTAGSIDIDLPVRAAALMPATAQVSQSAALQTVSRADTTRTLERVNSGIRELARQLSATSLSIASTGV